MNTFLNVCHVASPSEYDAAVVYVGYAGSAYYVIVCRR
jgi:hypothetical protein